VGRATVKDVAARAGVSPKTVSNVMNGTFPVAPATRERVERAMDELDYVPNFSARGLRNGRTGMIALALPELNTAYSAELAHHFVHQARAQGWAIQIEETKGGPNPEHQLMLKARARLVDGLILNPISLETSAIQPGIALPPVVVIGEVDQPIADHVWIDNVAASAAMVAHLADRGRRRIAAVGVMDSESARLRIKGYRRGLAEAGLPYDAAVELPTPSWGPGGAARTVADLLARVPEVDALFCFTDALAMGALHVLAKSGRRVPDDIAVAGYDDIWESAFFAPALTTIGFDKAELARVAIELLVRRITTPDRAPETVTLPYELVVRDST
jgi:LacI family repressor for deo operon, udp, cdd, tsx, nupC, and nupG